MFGDDHNYKCFKTTFMSMFERRRSIKNHLCLNCEIQQTAEACARAAREGACYADKKCREIWQYFRNR